jgi:hypothetical protein
MTGAADMRGFRWPAQALQVKLHIDVQRARAALAQAVQARGKHEEAVATLEQQRLQEEGWTASRLAMPDPRSYVHALARLVKLQDDAAQLTREQAAAQGRAADALAACVARDRALRLVEDLRERAERAHLAGQQRRAAAEADAAWLARSHAARLRSGGAR